MSRKQDDLEEILSELENIGPPAGDLDGDPDSLLPDEVPALLHGEDDQVDGPATGDATEVETVQRTVEDPTAPSGFITVPVKTRIKKISQGGQVIRAAIPVAGAVPENDPNSQILEILTQMRKDFENVSGEILGTWREDRTQIQEVIDIYLNVVRAGGDIPRVYIESLVKALEVKANTSITAVKLLDAKTRLLQALKGGTSVMITNNNNNANVAEGELTKLLTEPLADDFVE